MIAALMSFIMAILAKMETNKHCISTLRNFSSSRIDRNRLSPLVSSARAVSFLVLSASPFPVTVLSRATSSSPTGSTLTIVACGRTCVKTTFTTDPACSAAKVRLAGVSPCSPVDSVASSVKTRHAAACKCSSDTALVAAIIRSTPLSASNSISTTNSRKVSSPSPSNVEDAITVIKDNAAVMHSTRRPGLRDLRHTLTPSDSVRNRSSTGKVGIAQTTLRNSKRCTTTSSFAISCLSHASTTCVISSVPMMAAFPALWCAIVLSALANAGSSCGYLDSSTSPPGT